MKIFILPLALITVIQLTQSATLRRKPKIYNALITTDQNLTPSRAYPVIQPHLRETFAYPYPSYSYRNYAPLGLYNSGFQYGPPAASSIASYNGYHSYPRLNPGLIEARNYFPRDDVHTTIPPIPLNDFGLPPAALVPINSFAFGNLAPYPYSSYPLIYNQYSGYGGGGSLLPPFPFYPSESEGGNSADKGNEDGIKKDEDGKKESSSASDGSSGVGSSGSSESNEGGSSNIKSSRLRNKPEYPQQQSLNENIKNFPNKDPNIPDVPPPPIGRKAVDI